MQQVGASLGLAVLVTVCTSVGRHAAAHPRRGAQVAAAPRALVEGVTRAFTAGTGRAVCALLVAVLVIRPGGGVARAG